MFRLSKIKGISMSPSYLEGDIVLSISSKFVKLKLGDVILFDHDRFGFLIKEIAEIIPEGYYVRGTNPMSTDSKTIGLITPKKIKGRVIFKIKSNN